MTTDNAKQNEEINIEEETEIDLEQFDQMLSAKLEGQFADLEILREQHANIGNPDKLGKIVLDTVWEQLNNNIAAVAGEDFIKDNGNLTLDLRNDAHIQTTENFAKGKIVSHNKEIDYQERYDNQQNNFEKDANGDIKYHKDRTGNIKENLAPGARAPYDKNRPNGSKEKGTAIDHIVSAGEIIRDPEANAHLTEQQKLYFANSPSNLNEMDSRQNQSKSDLTMKEWLDTPNAKGQTPIEIFDNLSDKEKEKLYEKDKEARKEYEKVKKDGEQRSIEAGKESQKKEAFRIGGKALRAAVMQLLAEFVKEVVRKFIKWLKVAKKTVQSLLSYIKEAVKKFVSNLHKHLLNSGRNLLSTIATAILGPITRTIMKVFTMLKQGVKSFIEAIAFLRKPENRKKPISVIVAQIGKILVGGIVAGGALMLGEVVEKGLMTIPPLAIEIPLLGSLASILGLAIGGLISGLVGAIILNYIDKFIANKLKADTEINIIDKSNEIINTQTIQLGVAQAIVVQTRKNSFDIINENHVAAREIMNESVNNIFKKYEQKNTKLVSENQNELDEFQKELKNLL